MPACKAANLARLSRCRHALARKFRDDANKLFFRRIAAYNSTVQCGIRVAEARFVRLKPRIIELNRDVQEQSCALKEFPDLKESNMKTRWVSMALGATLFAAAGMASAQQMYYRTAQVPGQANADTYTQAQMDQNANPSTQSGDPSYGGTSMMSRSASGMSDSAASKPCERGPNCSIFFGQ